MARSQNEHNKKIPGTVEKPTYNCEHGLFITIIMHHSLVHRRPVKMWFLGTVDGRPI